MLGSGDMLFLETVSKDCTSGFLVRQKLKRWLILLKESVFDLKMKFLDEDSVDSSLSYQTTVILMSFILRRSILYC